MCPQCVSDHLSSDQGLRNPKPWLGLALSSFRITPLLFLLISFPLFLAALTALMFLMGLPAALLESLSPAASEAVGQIFALAFLGLLGWLCVSAVKRETFMRSFFEGIALFLFFVAVNLWVLRPLGHGFSRDWTCVIGLVAPMWAVAVQPRLVDLLNRAVSAAQRSCTIGLLRPFREAPSARARKLLAPTIASYGRLVIVSNPHFQRVESPSFFGWGPDSLFRSEGAEVLRDETWKSEIVTFVDELDIAVFDVSDYTDNIDFEFELVLSRMPAARVVLVHRGPLNEKWRPRCEALQKQGALAPLPIDLLFRLRFFFAMLAMK